MNKFSTVLIASMTIAASAAFAADDMKHDDAMMKKDMTMQKCKDHMAMAKKDGMKKDDAMMKKDMMCNEMMSKDPSSMKRKDTGVDPMKK